MLGYDVPLYAGTPSSDKERENNLKYTKVLGSAVNPVLREGNSDRRVAGPVKAYAMKNPHSMGNWSKASRSHVAHMTKGDFYASEVSYTVPAKGSVSIEHTAADGTVTILKEKVALLEGEIIGRFERADVAFPALEGHNDEDLRSYHVRTCCHRLFQGCLC